MFFWNIYNLFLISLILHLIWIQYKEKQERTGDRPRWSWAYSDIIYLSILITKQKEKNFSWSA